MSSIIKNMSSVTSLLSDVSYKNWVFKVRESAGGFLLSVMSDIDTLQSVMNVETRYRKPLAINEWYISRYATDTEVVRTAYKAVMFIEMFVCEHAQFVDMDKYTEMTFDEPEIGDRERAAVLLSAFKYKDWRVRTEERDGGLMIQLIFDAPDNDNPEETGEQHCRKFFYMYGDINELFLTLQYAIRAAEEHECNEVFRYMGKQIYNPHMDLDAIVEFINTNEFDHR